MAMKMLLNRFSVRIFRIWPFWLMCLFVATGSLCDCSCTGIFYVDQAGPELPMTCLSLPPESWKELTATMPGSFRHNNRRTHKTSGTETKSCYQRLSTVAHSGSRGRAVSCRLPGFLHSKFQDSRAMERDPASTSHPCLPQGTIQKM